HPDANKHDPKAASRFAELNAAYEIVGDKEKRKAFDGGEIDAEGKPRFQGFEGRQPGAGGGFGQGGGFETFTWGQEGAHAAGGPAGARGFGGFEDILKDVFGARGAAGRGRAGGGVHFEPEDFGVGSGGGRDISAALSITLPEAAKGVSKRVQLPTGKE